MEKKTLLEENADSPNMKRIYDLAVKDDGYPAPPFLHINKKKNRFFKRWDREILDEAASDDEEDYENETNDE